MKHNKQLNAMIKAIRLQRQIALVMAFFGAVFIFILALSAAPTQAAMPMAGYNISNQAEASYYHTRVGSVETVRSNTTLVEVLAIQGLLLESNQQRVVSQGNQVAISHRLTNTGNTDADIDIMPSNMAGDDYDLGNMKAYIDSNNNGILDSTDIEHSAGDMISLAAQQSVDLLLVGAVPVYSLEDMNAEATLTAFIPGTSMTASVLDTVIVANSAVLEFHKKANVNKRQPGEAVTFMLTGTNTGNASMEPITVTIDGQSQQRVIIRDNIPLNTELLAFIDSGTAETLYHIAGSQDHEYVTTAPQDKGLIDAVAFAYMQVPAGFSFELSFSIKANHNSGNDIRNIAQAHFSTLGEDVIVDSNQVVVSMPAMPSEVSFMSSSMAARQYNISAGDSIHLSAEAAACNLDASVVESYTVILKSELTGDIERDFLIVETGPNSGTFTFEDIVTSAWPSNRQVNDNGQLEVARNDVINARWDSCPGVLLETRLLVDPAGIVFDSRNNQPVAGARVILQGINADGSLYIPTVLDNDLNPRSNEFITDADGFYEFPLVPPGNYQLLVIPPNGYAFTSSFAPALLSPERRVDLDGSYYGSFPVNAETGAVFFDIPLDPINLSGLFIEKSASRTTASVGATVLYTVKLTNNTLYDMFNISVDDYLPTGFAYVKGTTKLNGIAFDDPQGADSSALHFPVNWLKRDSSITFNYRVQVRSSALRGDGINRVRAINDNAESNMASAQISIAEDVFTDEGFITGKIFTDCDNNRQQNTDEIGIPAVRLYLQNGSFVVTDAEGKYSFAGVKATTHVLKIDVTTLPPGAEMATLNNRHGGDALSHFVDVKRGELFRADFAEGSCTPEVIEMIKERRAQGYVRVADIEQRLASNLLTANSTVQQDRRRLPSSGIISGDGKIAAFTSLNENQNIPTRSMLSVQSPVKQQSVNMEEQIKTFGPQLDFIDLENGDTLASSQLSIRVKGVAGGRLRLSINDQPLPESRIGQRVVMSSSGVQAWEFVAVRLEPGENRLLLEQLDQFDNNRGSKAITVLAPGDLGQLEINTPTQGSAADGHTSLPVTVKLKDSRGTAVTARTAVNLESTLGQWLVEDLDPAKPGIQTFVTGGQAVFELLPPDVPGEALLRVSSGVMESSYTLEFLPDLRPLVVSGIFEAAAGVGKLDNSRLTKAAASDGFEETIGSFNFASNSEFAAGVRTALYLKGKIRGNHLLTLSYDSDRGDEERLFRDIRPDEFYPVYGDAATKGFDAQSTSKLYVRVDKGRSYIQYGDFTTRSNNEAQRLANYSRSLTGVSGHYETDHAEVNAFASHDYSTQRVREFPAKGISGPYPLDNRAMIRHSEKVEILVRDREQPSLVLESRTLVRFADYSLDFFTGDLIFKQPIGSIDANLNPVSIRVTFEVDSDQQSYWLYGASGQLQIGDRLELGLSTVQDENPTNNYQLYGANATLEITDNDKLLVEYAQSADDIEGSGKAARIELQHLGETVDVRLQAVQSDESFVNPNASVRSGRDEASLRLAWRMDSKTRMESELIHSEESATDNRRQGATVKVERQLWDSIRLELGLRHVADTTSNDDQDSSSDTVRRLSSGLARLGWQPQFLPEATMFTEYEQQFSAEQSSRTLLGGEYQVSNRGRIYARHELSSSNSGEFGLGDTSARNQSTLVGMDFDYMQDGHMFSEYRVRDAISGGEAEAAIGLRNSWKLNQNWSVNGGFERVMSMEDDGEGESLSITSAVDYTGSERWKGTTRLELRRSDSTDSVLSTLGVARKLNLNWSALAQNTLSLREERSNGKRITDDRLRLGISYRDTDSNRLSVLTRYELKYNDDESTGNRRSAHVWSGQVNWHPTRALTISGRYAGKYAEEHGEDYQTDFTGHLLSSRLIYDISERVDIAVMAGILTNDGVKSRHTIAGIEAGYLLTTNLWLSVGYNLFTVKDQDLSDSDYRNSGIYARLRLKFDEDAFGWLQ